MTEAPSPSGPYTFRMPDHAALQGAVYNSVIGEIRSFVNASDPFINKERFNTFLHGIAAIITKHRNELTLATPLFDREIEPINKGWEFRFRTPWGGVANKNLDTPDNIFYKVRKYLVILDRGLLGFEFHHKKRESLKVLEGLCIGVASIHGAKGWKEGQVLLTLMKPGDTCTLEPGDEHGIIALTKSVVEEKASEDTGGDLFFIFPAEQIEELN